MHHGLVHEAGVAARALEGALAEARAAGRRGPFEALEVTFDPLRVTEDSLRFHLELALREAGLAMVAIRMAPVRVVCPTCGAAVTGEAWPLCETCGAAVPATGGPMAEAHFAD